MLDFVLFRQSGTYDEELLLHYTAIMHMRSSLSRSFKSQIDHFRHILKSFVLPEVQESFDWRQGVTILQLEEVIISSKKSIFNIHKSLSNLFVGYRLPLPFAFTNCLLKNSASSTSCSLFNHCSQTTQSTCSSLLPLALVCAHLLFEQLVYIYMYSHDTHIHISFMCYTFSH